MLIPSTRVEDEKLGEASDNVIEKVKETGQEALEHGKQVAQERPERAGDRQGERPGARPAGQGQRAAVAQESTPPAAATPTYPRADAHRAAAHRPTSRYARVGPSRPGPPAAQAAGADRHQEGAGAVLPARPPRRRRRARRRARPAGSRSPPPRPAWRSRTAASSTSCVTRTGGTPRRPRRQQRGRAAGDAGDLTRVRAGHRRPAPPGKLRAWSRRRPRDRLQGAHARDARAHVRRRRRSGPSAACRTTRASTSSTGS